MKTSLDFLADREWYQFWEEGDSCANLLSRGGQEHVGAVQVVWIILRVAWGIEPGVMSFIWSRFNIFGRLSLQTALIFSLAQKQSLETLSKSKKKSESSYWVDKGKSFTGNKTTTFHQGDLWTGMWNGKRLVLEFLRSEVLTILIFIFDILIKAWFWMHQ